MATSGVAQSHNTRQEPREATRRVNNATMLSNTNLIYIYMFILLYANCVVMYCVSFDVVVGNKLYLILSYLILSYLQSRVSLLCETSRVPRRCVQISGTNLVNWE